MYLTHETYKKRIKELNSFYWNEGIKYRWLYMKVVIEWMKKLQPETDPHDSYLCEIGCSGIPLNSYSDQLNYPESDMNKIPYLFPKLSGHMGEIPDKFYDISVALQVWEHLNKPREAFKELARISKNIILSFPYKWNFGDKRHKGIDDKKIMSWTHGIVPAQSMVIMQRNICLWTPKELEKI